MRVLRRIVIVGLVAAATVTGVLVGTAVINRAPAARAPMRVVLFGDSLSVQALPYFRAPLEATGKVTVAAHVYGGTAPCDWVDEARQVAATGRPDVVVLQFSGNALTPCMRGVVDDTAAYWARYRADTEALAALFVGAGADVYLVGGPVSYGQARSGDRSAEILAALYASLAAAQPGGVRYVGAGAAVEGPGGVFTWTLPCLASEPCTGPMVGGVPSNIVRSPDGAHFCPIAVTGSCPVYSSGAFRYASAMASPIERRYHL